MDQDHTTKWRELNAELSRRFEKTMTMESLLFLIGMRELGSTPREFSKEEKVDLMHIAMCRLLSSSGYYTLAYRDQDGWPHWEAQKPLPHTDMFSQEHLLREHILAYFEEEEILG